MKKIIFTFFVFFLMMPFFANAAVWTQPARAFATVYQNTGTTNLFLTVSGADSSANELFVMYVGSTTPPATKDDATQACWTAYSLGTSLSNFCTIFMVVPPNSYYEFAHNGSGSLNGWSEYQESAQSGSGTTTTLQLIGLAVGTSSTAQIDNANQDYFYGILVFIGSVWFVIWVFRGGRRS